MSKQGDCWDNAVAESFLATLETEVIMEADRPTRDGARRATPLVLPRRHRRGGTRLRNREKTGSHMGLREPATAADLGPPSGVFFVRASLR